MTAPNLADPNSREITPPADQNPNSNTGNPQSSNNDSPANLSIDTTGRDLYLAAIREKNQQIEELNARIREQAQPPRKTGEDGWRELTDDPRAVIQDEVARAVKPINDFVGEMRRNQAFQGLKMQVAGMDPINRLILEKFGHIVDQALTNAAPTLDNVIGAINLVAGAIATGKVQGATAADLVPNSRPANNPPTNTKPTPRLVPPSIEPSSHPINSMPDKNQEKPWENLTETELAMARHYQMTPEEYWKNSQGSQIEVPTTKRGKNAPNSQPKG